MKFKITALSLVSIVILNLSPAFSGEWTPVVTGVETDFFSIWGSSSTNVFAVGQDTLGPPNIYHYNGSSWSAMQPWSCPHPDIDCSYPPIYEVWGTSESDVFALWGSSIIHYDGTNWSHLYSSDIYPELHVELYGIWGSSSSNVYVVGGTFRFLYWAYIQVKPIILHYDGVNWTQGYIKGIPGATATGIWGSSEDDIFAVVNGFGSQILHYDGNSWTVMKRLPLWLYGVWGSSGTDVFAVGVRVHVPYEEEGVIWHYDGQRWTQMETGQNMVNFHPRALWGSSGENVYVGGWVEWGETPFPIFHYDGSAWSAIANPGFNVESIWGSSASDIYAAGYNDHWEGVILHYDGTDGGIAE
jgi:hypothetical protein